MRHALLTVAALSLAARAAAAAPIRSVSVSVPSAFSWHVSDPPLAAPGVVVYDADVQVELEAASLRVDATLTIVPQPNGSAEVHLLLNRALRVESVEGRGVRGFQVGPSEFTPAWQRIAIMLDEVSQDSTPVALRIVYGGTPEFSGDGINSISPDRVELTLDSQWFPVIASLDHDMVGELRVQLPSSWHVAASGSAALADGRHHIVNRVPQIDVAFVAVPAAQRLAGERFVVQYTLATPRTAAVALQAAEQCGRFLDARFGGRDPFPGGTIVLADRNGPGYARKNYIVLSQIDPDRPDAVREFLCHEIAHYWTRSAGVMSPEHWMSEAFAEYAAALFVRDAFGRSAFDDRVATWEQAGRTHGPVWTPALSGRPSFALMYRRAPWLLSQLEARMGGERFGRFFDGAMVQGISTTDGLLEHLAQVGGREVAAWFREALASQATPGEAR